MPESHARYASESRRRMVELVRARRSPDELAKEFEPTAQSIRDWVAQTERDAGRRLAGLTSEERQELARLWRENQGVARRRDVRELPCQAGMRLDRNSFRTQVEGDIAVFEFIEGSYNPHCRHSAIDYLSPSTTKGITSHKDLPQALRRPTNRG